MFGLIKKNKVLNQINAAIQELENMEYKVVMIETTDPKEKHEIIKSLSRIQGGLISLKALKRKIE